MYIYHFQYKRTYSLDYQWVDIPKNLLPIDLEDLPKTLQYAVSQKKQSIHVKKVDNGFILCKYLLSSQLDEYGRSTHEIQGLFIDTTDPVCNCVKYHVLSYILVQYFCQARDFFNTASNIVFVSLDRIYSSTNNSDRFFSSLENCPIQDIDFFVDSNLSIQQNPIISIQIDSTNDLQNASMEQKNEIPRQPYEEEKEDLHPVKILLWRKKTKSLANHTKKKKKKKNTP